MKTLGCLTCAVAMLLTACSDGGSPDATTAAVGDRGSNEGGGGGMPATGGMAGVGGSAGAAGTGPGDVGGSDAGGSSGDGGTAGVSGGGSTGIHSAGGSPGTTAGGAPGAGHSGVGEGGHAGTSMMMGTGGGSPCVLIKVEGSGFDASDGRPVRATPEGELPPGVLLDTTSVVVGDGAFTFEYVRIEPFGDLPALRVWVDTDNDAMCGPAETSFEIASIPAGVCGASGNFTVSVTPTTITKGASFSSCDGGAGGTGGSTGGGGAGGG